MSCEELEIVWNNIKAEARTLADCEPMLASFYHATLLKHENLGSALSYMPVSYTHLTLPTKA